MKTPLISTDAARLLAAAAVLRERGHCQGTAGLFSEGPVCIMQALAIVDDHPLLSMVIVPRALLEAVAPSVQDTSYENAHPWIRVAFYNDMPSTSQREAMAMLEEAAALA